MLAAASRKFRVITASTRRAKSAESYSWSEPSGIRASLLTSWRTALRCGRNSARRGTAAGQLRSGSMGAAVRPERAACMVEALGGSVRRLR